MKRVRSAQRAVLVVSAALVLTTGVGACSSDESGDSGSATYKIGLITSSAGAFATASGELADGVKYAVKQINDAGGIDGHEIELVQGDLQGDPANSSTVVPKVAGGDIVAMAGPVTSGEVEIAFALANKLGIPSLTTAARPGVLEGARPFGWSFTQVETEITPPVLTKYLTDEGFKTGAIIGDSVTATTAAQVPLFKSLLKDTGIKLVSAQEFSAGDASFASQATAIKAAKPDVVMLAAGPDDAGRIAAELRSQGVEAQLVGGPALQASAATYIAAGGKATEGTVTPAQYDDKATTEPQAGLLAQTMKDLDLDAVPYNVAAGFDAVNLIAKMIEEAEVKPSDDVESARKAINEGLTGLDEYEGMTGTFSFSEGGVAQRSHFLAKVENGTFVITGTVN